MGIVQLKKIDKKNIARLFLMVNSNSLYFWWRQVYILQTILESFGHSFFELMKNQTRYRDIPHKKDI